MVARRAADTVFRASPPSENYRVVSGYHTLAAAVSGSSVFTSFSFLSNVVSLVIGWLTLLGVLMNTELYLGPLPRYSSLLRVVASSSFSAKEVQTG